MVRVKSPQDLGAAILLFGIGVGAIWFGREYETGTAGAMGPGYMPMLLSGGLIIFSGLIGFRALTIEGPPLSPTRWRPLILILLSILCFALLIRTAGLLATAFVVPAVAAAASSESRRLQTIALCAFLAVFCVLVFVYGLGQAIPVFGGE